MCVCVCVCVCGAQGCVCVCVVNTHQEARGAVHQAAHPGHEAAGEEAVELGGDAASVRGVEESAHHVLLPCSPGGGGPGGGGGGGGGPDEEEEGATRRRTEANLESRAEETVCGIRHERFK